MSSEIFPTNYNVYRNDRGTLGGGVFVLVEKSITSVEQTSLITDGEIEWVKIKIKNNKDLLVGSFYMPHRDQKHLNELQKSLEKARTNGNTNVILTGDFNCPDIIWDTATALGPDREIQQGLVDIAETYNLTQIHTIPTREGNLLDLVFVTNPTLVKSSNNVPGISDHDIIITDLETKVHHQKSLPRKCYIYKKAKWDQITTDLKHTLEEVKEKHHQGAEVHQLWDTFKSQLQKTMNTNIPNKEIRSRNNIPWIKHKQRKMLKKKQRLYKQARKTNKWSNYRSFQKECKKQLRKAEYEYVNQNIFEGLNNNDTKPFWKYIKSKRQDSGGIAPLKKGTNLVSDSVLAVVVSVPCLVVVVAAVTGWFTYRWFHKKAQNMNGLNNLPRQISYYESSGDFPTTTTTTEHEVSSGYEMTDIAYSEPIDCIDNEDRYNHIDHTRHREINESSTSKYHVMVSNEDKMILDGYHAINHFPKDRAPNKDYDRMSTVKMEQPGDLSDEQTSFNVYNTVPSDEYNEDTYYDIDFIDSYESD
ncbi:unnamed protein product [Mytilus edulis]|uniref:Endonuclease/exonuclease/phosphatase domain-containing protein n=1 Tax=Mytilus edulis TaxID=6550 RepID=A0A8S3Q5A3_MYTED|nr:unnamed protein product [Mytilus edulis]